MKIGLYPCNADKIREMYKNMTAKQIAKELGVGLPKLHKFIEDNDIYKERCTKEQLMEDYKTMSTKEMMAKYNVSRCTINNWLRKHGIKKYKAAIDYEKLWKEAKNYVELTDKKLYKKLCELENVNGN